MNGDSDDDESLTIAELVQKMALVASGFSRSSRRSSSPVAAPFIPPPLSSGSFHHHSDDLNQHITLHHKPRNDVGEQEERSASSPKKMLPSPERKNIEVSPVPSHLSSSLPSTTGGGSNNGPQTVNPVAQLVTDFYAKQQEAILKKRRSAKQQQQPPRQFLPPPPLQGVQPNVHHSVEEREQSARVIRQSDPLPPRLRAFAANYHDKSTDSVEGNPFEDRNVSDSAKKQQPPGENQSVGAVDVSITSQASRSLKSVDVSGVSQRLFSSGKDRHATLESIRRQKEEVEFQSFPFQPTITPTPSKNKAGPSSSVLLADRDQDDFGSYGQVDGQAGSFLDRVVARQEISDRHLDVLRAVRDLNIAAQCPFKPEVAHKGCEEERSTQFEKSTASYQHRLVDSDWHRNQKMVDAQNKDCTFHPRIGPRSHLVYETSRIEEGKMDIYSRLYARSAARQVIMTQHPHSSDAATTTEMPQPNNNAHQLQAHRFKERIYVHGPAVEEELDHLRQHFSLVRNCHVEKMKPEVEGATCMTPFLCNVHGVTSIGDVPVVACEKYFAYGFTENKSADAMEHVPGKTFRVLQFALQEDEDIDASGSHIVKKDNTNITVISSFNSFLERQIEKDRERKHKMKALYQSTAPSCHPAMCPRSRSLCDKRREEEFHDPHRTLANECSPRARRKRQFEEEQEKRFKPTLCPQSKRTASRTTDDMFLDSQRRQEKLSAQQREKDLKSHEEEQTYFAPLTNNKKPKFQNVVSLLKPTNLLIYQEQLEKKKRLHQDRREEAEKRERDLELVECKFKPAINHTPSYVSQMALGFSLMKHTQLV